MSSCWLEWECRVYNRWGGVVWQSNDPVDRWDGGDTFAYVPNGVYTWTIRGTTFRSTKVISIQGFVTLIR